jgi:hypothetical protein
MPAERYRKLATKLHAEASNEECLELRVELEHFAQCYVLLAKQATLSTYRVDPIRLEYRCRERSFLPT